MGSCFSSDYESVDFITAKVVSVTGTLREYAGLVTVSQVLQSEPSSSFLCNSDSLYYDEYIQALDCDEFIQMGQIYFVLPKSRLQYRLTASDMAALAVKASSALNRNSKKGGSGRKRMRVSPVSEVSPTVLVVGDDHQNDRLKTFEKSPAVVMARSRSVKKLQRSASRRAWKVYRSFKMRLSTIHEGTVAE